MNPLPETKLVMKRISVLRFGLILGSIYAVLYLIAGIVWTFAVLPSLSPLLAAIPGASEMGLAGFDMLGALAVILFPIIGFIGGLVSGAVLALLYNLVSRRLGGFIITVDETA